MSTHRSEWKATGALFGAAVALVAVGCGSAGVDQDDAIGTLSGALTVEKCSAAAVNGKVTLCHATASAKNPYVRVSVSVNACRNGHAGHDGDFISLDGTCPSTDLCKGVKCPGGDACFGAATCDPATGACLSELRPDAAPLCTGECPSVDGAWTLSDGTHSWPVTLSGDTCDFEMTCPGAPELSGFGDGRELSVNFLVDGKYPVECPGTVDGESVRFDCALDLAGSTVELSYVMERAEDGSATCEGTGDGDEDGEDGDGGNGPGEPGDGSGDGGAQLPGDDIVECPCFDVGLLRETWEMWNDLSSTSDWNLAWELPDDADWAVLYWSVGTTVPYRETWVGGFTVQDDFCSAGRYQPGDDVVDFMVNETIAPEQSQACRDVFQDFVQSRQ